MACGATDKRMTRERAYRLAGGRYLASAPLPFDSVRTNGGSIRSLGMTRGGRGPDGERRA
jgi:hypothetical protein